MIVKLIGLLDEKNDDHVIINVQGICYAVFMPKNTVESLSSVEEKITLYTVHIIKQDAQLLCGFLTRIEKKWFELLTTVQGVGTKVALAILSNLNVGELENAILFQDPLPLKAAEGVGLKVANRIVLELKNKIPSSTNNEEPAQTSEANNTKQMLFNDTLEALIQLGYIRAKASQTLKKIIKEHPSANESELIKLALQSLHK